MSGHVRSSNVGCDGTHGGFGYGVFAEVFAECVNQLPC